MSADAGGFVSRGGVKLAHALDVMGINPAGWSCADLGCSTGGFTDCLLQRGAASVCSVDTGYGVLAYKLRIDPRVKVMERSNALHVEPPGLVDLVVMDVSWTPMRHALPAALRWLRPDAAGGILALVKPHYERSSRDRTARGVLSEDEAALVTESVTAEIEASLPLRVQGKTSSPIKGGGGRHKEGNPEWLVWFKGAVRPS